MAQTGSSNVALSNTHKSTESGAQHTLRRFLSGSLSGTLTAAVLQPFDVIRTTQQSNLKNNYPQHHRPGPLYFARRIASEQGTLALWKGLQATLLRVFFGAGVYFVTLDKVSKAVAAAATTVAPIKASGPSHTGTSSSSSSFVKSNTAASFVSGAVARTIAAVLLSPVAVVKTRMEFAPRGQSGFNNPLHGIFKIARTEGMAGLYSGLLATVLRDAPYSGLYFAAYQYLVQSMDRMAGQEAAWWSGAIGSIPASGKNFVAALVAGACATLVTQPADLIRTQQQLAVSGAWMVISSSMGRNAHCAMGFFVHSCFMLLPVAMFGTLQALKAPPAETASAAKATAATATASSASPSAVSLSSATIKRILAEGGGLGALFIGSTARILKRALSTAITWTLFEEAMRRSGGGGGGG